MRFDASGVGYAAGGSQAPGGTVTHATGGAPDTGRGGVGDGPGNRCGTLGGCPPIPGAQGPEDMDPCVPKGPAGSVGALFGLDNSGKGIFVVTYGLVGPRTRIAGPG